MNSPLPGSDPPGPRGEVRARRFLTGERHGASREARACADPAGSPSRPRRAPAPSRSPFPGKSRTSSGRAERRDADAHAGRRPSLVRGGGGPAPARRLPGMVGRGLTRTRHAPRRHSGPTCYRTREAESAKMARRGHCRFRGSPCAFPRVHTCSPPAHAQSHAPQPAGPRRGPLRAPRPGGLAGARGPAGPSPAPGGVRAASPGAERGLRDGCLCPRARPADALPPGRASRT